MSVTHLLYRKWILFTIYLLLLSAPIVLEHSDIILRKSECERIPLSLKFAHQWLCAAGYLKPKVRFVRLVTLSKNIEPIQDKCEAREFMATLLSRLVRLRPALIVIDKWYYPHSCTNSPGTGALLAAIAQISEQVPIVFAQDSDTLDELRANNDPQLSTLVTEGFTDKDQLAQQDFLVPGNGKSIFYGLARLNCDTRRMPLMWHVYPNAASVREKKKVGVPSLSLAAADVLDKDVETNIQAFVSHSQHPFISFLSADKFKPTPAIRLVCATTPTDLSKWKDCAPPTVDASGLRNKVVLIGEYSSEDEHESVLGRVAGVVLQANYIESLLANRCFKSINRAVEAVLTILSFIIIYLIFERAQSPHLGLGGATIFVAALWGMSYLFIVQWGYLLTFWIPSALAIVVKYIDSLREHSLQRQGGEA